MKNDFFSQLVNLYSANLMLMQRSNSEALSADNALENGYPLKAQQHYQYAQTYRQQAQHKLEHFYELLESRKHSKRLFRRIISTLKKSQPDSTYLRSLRW